MQNFFRASPARPLESTNLNTAGKVLKVGECDGLVVTVDQLQLQILTPRQIRKEDPLDLRLSSPSPNGETDANRWENFYSRSVVTLTLLISVTKSSQLIKMS